jgi:transposase
MNKTLYVGIDVSKDKLDVAITIDGKQIKAHSVVSNDLSGFKKILKFSEKEAQSLKCNNIHYCLEATGIYHFKLTEFLQESTSNIISVINPLKTKSFAKSLMLRTKNDKVDAGMLAVYGYFHKPDPTLKTPEIIKEFRSLVRYLETLVTNRTEEIARLKSCLNKDVEQFIQKKLSFIEEQITEVTLMIKNLIKSDDFLKKQINLLKSIDCVGDKVSWKILSEIKFDKFENLSAKAQVAHAGLSPKERSSGSSVKGRSHICRMGNSSIRKTLFMPALNCIKNKNYFYDFYYRLLSNGKPKKVAITAIMRKILVTAIGVLRNQKPFDPNWAMKKQEEYLKIA